MRGVGVRQRGSHIQMQKHLRNEVARVTIPSHKPVKRSTLIYSETCSHQLPAFMIWSVQSSHLCNGKANATCSIKIDLK